MSEPAHHIPALPGTTADTKALFGVATPWEVPAYADPSPYTPEIDPSYVFDPAITRLILTGFAHNRRTLIQGWHGTGKSTHITQIAARLNWPCIRLNLDGHLTRMDLIGRDAILLEEGQQVTRFKEGILPWAMEQGAALVLDEYDAGRMDVMFVLQRVLEAEGKLTLAEQNRVITPHPSFRIFATANTVGLGDPTGLYHGTGLINQGQMDRWQLVGRLNYLPPERELEIARTQVPAMQSKKNQKTLKAMIALAGLTRIGLQQGDIGSVLSPRTVIIWAENYALLGDLEEAFCVSFLYKCDEEDWPTIAEYYQRATGETLQAVASVAP